MLSSCPADARARQAGADDARTVAHLLCEQLEFADVLLVNKIDLLDEQQLAAVERLLRKVNPTAEVIRAVRGAIEPSLLFEKARFSMRKAEDHPEWLAEAREPSRLGIYYYCTSVTQSCVNSSVSHPL